MKANFNGYVETEREVDLSQQDLNDLYKIMKMDFMIYIEFGDFDRISSHDDSRIALRNFCKKHGVNINYKKDRMAFFKSILDNIIDPFT